MTSYRGGYAWISTSIVIISMQRCESCRLSIILAFHSKLDKINRTPVFNHKQGFQSRKSAPFFRTIQSVAKLGTFKVSRLNWGKLCLTVMEMQQSQGVYTVEGTVGALASGRAACTLVSIYSFVYATIGLLQAAKILIWWHCTNWVKQNEHKQSQQSNLFLLQHQVK